MKFCIEEDAFELSEKRDELIAHLKTFYFGRPIHRPDVILECMAKTGMSVTEAQSFCKENIFNKE